MTTTPAEQLSFIPTTNAGIPPASPVYLPGAVKRPFGDWSGDIINVKSFGAIGDGSHDDTANIQAAIDWQTSNGSRGIIFFPPGTYKLTSSVTFNASVAFPTLFKGCGGASVISGNFAGYLLHRSNGNGPLGPGSHIDGLHFANGHAAGGCVQMGNSVAGSVTRCNFSGFRGLILCSDDFNSDQSMTVMGCNFSSNGLFAAIGLLSSANTHVIGCDLTGLGTAAIRAYGTGLVVSGCRMEVNTIGIELGRALDGSVVAMQGAVVIGGSFESNGIAIDCVNVGMCNFSGFLAHGFEGAAGYPGQGATFSGSTTATGSATTSTGTLTTIDASSPQVATFTSASAGGFKPRICLGASFTASISGTTLTVSAISSGAIYVGATITLGAAANTQIVADIGGSGGTGTYLLDTSQTVSSTAMTTGTLSANALNSFTGQIAGTTLTVTNAGEGNLLKGAYIFGAGVTNPTNVVAFGTGTGGNGTYTVNVSQTVGPVAMTAPTSPQNTIFVDTITGTSILVGTYLYQQLTATTPGQRGRAGTYALTGNPQYIIHTNNEQNTLTVASVVGGGQMQQATFYQADTTNLGANTWINCSASNASSLGGLLWRLPTNPKWGTCINCVGLTAAQLSYTYANLPPIPGGSPSVITEGFECNITDGLAANCSDAACGWGANVTGGGGALHLKVRYNGTNWTVVGK